MWVPSEVIVEITLVISIIAWPYSSLSMFILGIANRDGRIPKRAKGLFYIHATFIFEFMRQWTLNRPVR